MNIKEATKSLEDEESIASNSSSEYVCGNDFLVDEKTCEMIKTLGIDSYSVRKFVGIMQGIHRYPQIGNIISLPLMVVCYPNHSSQPRYRSGKG